jgi:hypothetical protein
VAVVLPALRWHLIWFTPIALIGAYLYSLRGLFVLSNRVNEIAKSGISDPEQIKKSLEIEVEKYNRDSPEDAKMK